MPMAEDVYRLCIAQPTNYSEVLYLKLKELLTAHVESEKKELLELQSDFLTDYLRRWNNYSTGSSYFGFVFRYLNMHWIKKQQDDSRNRLTPASSHRPDSEIFETQILALVVWKNAIFDTVKERLAKGIIELATKDRDGEQVNQQLIYGLVFSFVKLGAIKATKALEIYKTDLEPSYLKALNEYYARESSQFIAENGIPAYMTKVETRIQEEEARCKKWLDNSSFERVKKECDEVLIVKHQPLLQVECESMLKSNNIEGLRLMYKLLGRVHNGLQPMLETLYEYIVATGFDAVKELVHQTKEKEKEAADRAKEEAAAAAAAGTKVARARAIQNAEPTVGAQEYVEVLLAIHYKFADVVKTAFNSDPLFIGSMDKGCRRVVNDNSIGKETGKTPELIAKYTDQLLKKSTKHMDENELDTKLSQIILVFKYVDDKDVFQKFYSKMLAKRLIHSTSVSDDAEKVMIAGLKETCGFDYTVKLQRMFTDIQTSTDTIEKFKDFTIKRNTPLNLDFTIMVLTTGSWPLPNTQSKFRVPQELEGCINQFTEFYNEQYNGRKLNWLHHLSKGDLKMLFTKKRYEFQVTNYQMGILLLFNQNESYTVEDIAAGVGLQDSELNRTIQSLVDAKILKKSGEKSYQPADTITLNKAFVSKRMKFKVSAVLQAETPQQNAETRKLVEDDRKIYLQAAIVRIMKSRKQLNHNNLIKEVIEQSRARFQPNVGLIKKCIEFLIEKDYLERSGDNDTYIYKA